MRNKKNSKLAEIHLLPKPMFRGEIIWPPIAAGDELTNVSVLHDGQLTASSAHSNPQFTQFFISRTQYQRRDLNPVFVVRGRLSTAKPFGRFLFGRFLVRGIAL